MADRFKAVSLCRSCEKKKRRRRKRKKGKGPTHGTDRHGGARRAVWLRLLGTAVKGCPRSGFSASRVCSQCVPVAQRRWQQWKWKRSYYSTDEVPREEKKKRRKRRKTAPCRTCPLRAPLLPSGWHRPPLCLLSAVRTHKHRHTTLTWLARAPCVLWTLQFKFRRARWRRCARVKGPTRQKLSHPSFFFLASQ